MATGKALDGKPYAGNPHVRFDEGEVAPAATPRRGSLLYRALFLVFMVMASALSIKAAAVQWGRIYLNENGNLECAFPISSFSIYCEFASASDGSSAWSFTPYGADLEFVGTVYEAKAGAHVNDRTVQRADSGWPADFMQNFQETPCQPAC